MGPLSFFKSKANDEITPIEAQNQRGVDEKKDCDLESFSSNAQSGVKAVEAATTVWTKYHLIGAYVM